MMQVDAGETWGRGGEARKVSKTHWDSKPMISLEKGINFHILHYVRCYSLEFNETEYISKENQ